MKKTRWEMIKSLMKEAERDVKSLRLTKEKLIEDEFNMGCPTTKEGRDRVLRYLVQLYHAKTDKEARRASLNESFEYWCSCSDEELEGWFR